MMLKTLSAAAGVLLTIAGFASSAGAQVTYDPDSPAGKQYEIPIDRVRHDASGATGSTRPGGSALGKGTGGATGSSPLFGTGVTPAVHAPSPKDRSATSSGTRQAPTRSPSNARRRLAAEARSAALDASVRAAQRAAEIGTGTGRPWLPFALALLAGAGAIALVLRRTRSR